MTSGSKIIEQTSHAAARSDEELFRDRLNQNQQLQNVLTSVLLFSYAPQTRN